MRLVIALGGNALSPAGDSGSVADLRAVLARTADALVDALEAGHQLVLTHGNGPQVGRLLEQQEQAAATVPPRPLDVCVALSQGELGYLISQELGAALSRRGHGVPVACLLSQVVVDPADPAFDRPTKRVGERVVASPQPRSLVERASLLALVEAGHLVIAAGGGGVAVAESGGTLAGLPAVVDKDRTSALVAEAVAADLLVVLTSVEQVEVGHGGPQARGLDRLTVAEARRLLAEGGLGEGSMAPKVEACAQFAAQGGRAAIGRLDRLSDVLAGRSGTQVVPG